MDLKLAATVYRLLDVLDAVEAYMKQADSNLSLECILSANQARQAVSSLEAMAGIEMKAFLQARVHKKVAHDDTMQ